MARTVAIGIQDFSDVIRNGYLYIDKTSFIREWWDSGDSVTLITRPRRFGKTLAMSMVEHFFSVKYAGEGDLFEDLDIWKDEKYRKLQGSYPVISLSFANVKETDFATTRRKICQLIVNLYGEYLFLKDSDVLNEIDRDFFRRVSVDMGDVEATMALYQLSSFLYRYYGRKVILLLDEYDTPMQEAYVRGYWEELTAFTRSLFNASFKTNPWLERALIFAALDECGRGTEKEKVKTWYDGFCFGSYQDIYNPWSILNFLDTGKYRTYWANTSSNSLVSKLLREGSRLMKEQSEDEAAYGREPQYRLALTNYEVLRTFAGMVRGWFRPVESDYNDFVKALLLGDTRAMNVYMNRVALQTFSYFDTGNRPGCAKADRRETV